MSCSVLLDTSFFIRLLKQDDPLHHHAKDYWKYFLENNYVLKTSIISIAEYCVGGNIHELPLIKIQILPFNILHAQRTGELASIAYAARKNCELVVEPRAIIPNDCKLFSQADIEDDIHYFVTSDVRSVRVLNAIQNVHNLNFNIIDIHHTYDKEFSVLDLKNT